MWSAFPRSGASTAVSPGCDRAAPRNDDQTTLAGPLRILRLDEPLSALDARVRVSLREEIGALQRRSGSPLSSSPTTRRRLAISDCILVMNEGAFEQVGAPADIHSRSKTRFVASLVGTLNLLDGLRRGTRVRRDPAGRGYDHCPRADRGRPGAVARTVRRGEKAHRRRRRRWLAWPGRAARRRALPLAAVSVEILWGESRRLIRFGFGTVTENGRCSSPW